MTELQTDDLDDTKMTIFASGEGWEAVMHPDVGVPRHGSPFGFRVAGDAPPASEVAQRLREQFQKQCTDAFESMDSDELAGQEADPSVLSDE